MFVIFFMDWKYLRINKLVRDNIPEMTKDEGGFTKFKILSNEEFLTEITKKIVEEAQEVVDAKDKQEMTTEIGDVLEIIDEIIKVSGIDKKEIEKSRIKKRQERSGFDNHIFLKSVKIPKDHKEDWVFRYKEITEKEYEND